MNAVILYALIYILLPKWWNSRNACTFNFFRRYAFYW